LKATWIPGRKIVGVGFTNQKFPQQYRQIGGIKPFYIGRSDFVQLWHFCLAYNVPILAGKDEQPKMARRTEEMVTKCGQPDFATRR
jgi:hypothetical protein